MGWHALGIERFTASLTTENVSLPFTLSISPSTEISVGREKISSAVLHFLYANTSGIPFSVRRETARKYIKRQKKRGHLKYTVCGLMLSAMKVQAEYI